LQKSIFNLADDEVLTHRGQTLSEIEKFDDPRSDDEEEEESEEKGKLGGEHYYIAAGHCSGDA
jgi:nucleolar protein 14